MPFLGQGIFKLVKYREEAADYLRGVGAVTEDLGQ
jgi:hypothetical protein